MGQTRPPPSCDERSSAAAQWAPSPNQASLSRNFTTSPTISRLGPFTSASITRCGSVASVPVSTRCCGEVPDSITAAGQSVGRPCSCNAVQICDSRSEEHTSELQSLMRNSYAVFCLKKKNTSYQILRQQ